MSYTYYASIGNLPQIAGLEGDGILNDLINGEIGIYESHLDSGPITDLNNFPYYPHLVLSPYMDTPLPVGIMHQYNGELPYYEHLRSGYIPVLKKEYPYIFVSENENKLPHYDHLKLIDMNLNFIYSNLKFNKNYAYYISYNKNPINNLTFNEEDIFSFYSNGIDFNYEEYANKKIHFINSDNLIFTEGGATE